VFKHSEAASLVVEPVPPPGVNELRGECLALRTVITPGKDYDAFLARGSHGEIAHELKDEDALISLNYTSGTSGYLKGVMYTHRGAYLNALGNAIEVELTSAARYLWTLPMFHCNGWCYPWAVTAVGGTHISLERPLPADV